MQSQGRLNDIAVIAVAMLLLNICAIRKALQLLNVSAFEVWKVLDLVLGVDNCLPAPIRDLLLGTEIDLVSMGHYEDKFMLLPGAQVFCYRLLEVAAVLMQKLHKLLQVSEQQAEVHWTVLKQLVFKETWVLN